MTDFTPVPKPVREPKKPRRYMTTKRRKNAVSEADKRYMLAVKRLPCCICGSRENVEAHHCICGRFGSHKPPAQDCIPLCIYCHRIGPLAIHNGKASWVARNGDDRDYIEQTRRLVNAGPV